MKYKFKQFLTETRFVVEANTYHTICFTETLAITENENIKLGHYLYYTFLTCVAFIWFIFV